MLTKLTLTIEKQIVEEAKIYAKNTGRSLSAMIETYLENIVKSPSNKPGKVSSRIDKIIGVAKLPKDFDEKRELREYLEKKHL